MGPDAVSDGIAMLAFEGRKGRRTAHTDILYFDISDDDTNDITIPLGPISIEKTIDVTNPIAAEILVAKNLSGSDDVWDAVVGITGQHQLNDQWKMNYKFDVGGGGSDLTWEAVAAVGYDYNWGELQMGYRYLHYDFDSSFDLLGETRCLRSLYRGNLEFLTLVVCVLTDFVSPIRRHKSS